MSNISRTILAGAAVVFLILAIVFGSTLLYVLAALLIVGIVVMTFAADKIRRFVANVSIRPSHSTNQSVARPEPGLSDLGIIEIRPKKAVNPVRGSGKGILEQEPELIDQLAKKPYVHSSSATTAETIPRSKPIRADDFGADAPGGDGDSSVGPPRSSDAPERDASEVFEVEFGDDLVSAPRPVKKKPVENESTDVRGKERASLAAGHSTARYPVAFAGESLDDKSIVPLLESAIASLGASTAVIVTRIGESSRYRIVSIVSVNERARSGGQFTADSPYLQRRRKKDEVVHLSKATSLDAGHSRYYDGDIAVQHQAIIPIAATTGDYLFITDYSSPVDDEGRIDPLMVGFAAALRALLSSSTILSNAALAKTSVVVSRALERARAEKSPLGMALVCMKDGERFLSSERDVVLAAERELEELLDDLTPHGKVEKLADLTFGVFLSEEVNRVEQWALSLQDAVDERATSSEITSSIVGSVTIGVAMLSDRHESADDLREDALAALEESFQSGACTILE